MMSDHSLWAPRLPRLPPVAPLLGFAATLVLSGAAAVAIALIPEAEPAPPRAATSTSSPAPGRSPGQHAGVGDPGYTDVSMDANGVPIAPWFYWEGRANRLGYDRD